MPSIITASEFDLSRLLRLLRKVGIDPIRFVQMAGVEALRREMLEDRKEVGSRARRAGYTPTVLSDDDAEKNRLVKYTNYALLRVGLPDIPGADLATDWLRDRMLAKVQAEVVPQVHVDLKERDFLEGLMIPAIVQNLPDLGELLED